MENKLDREIYNDLVKQINYHMNKYYNLDESEITDYEYDQLMMQLKSIEKEHPDWIVEDSPSQKIGGTVKREAGVKVIHNVPMLSIEDVFTKEEVTEWIDKVHKEHPEAEFSVEQKIDGLSITLRMERIENKLRLVLAETRGDGYIGEDVTANALVISDIKKELDLPMDYLELRGEVYMPHKKFEEFNDKQEQAGKKLAANPRNLAAGSMRQLDTSITKERGLGMLIFNVQDGPIDFIEDHVNSLNKLANVGVKVVYHKLCKTAEEVLDEIDNIDEMRGSIDHDIDGAVIKINQVSLRSSFTAGSKYTSGHIAYKYPPEEKTITINDIIVNVGRTGKLTFTAVFTDSFTGKPARLCGTNVNKATLHNQDYIDEMNIGLGGKYLLYKSGDIIPKLNGCVEKPIEVFKAPLNCPKCETLLIREEDTADIRCVNPSCPAQLSRAITYFASRDAMNIMGLGETLIEALVSEGYLKSYADIYNLKEYKEELIEKGIIGKVKNTNKLLDEIEKSKNNSAERLLTGLGIRNVGKISAKSILNHFTNIEELINISLDQLCYIDDIGEITARCIKQFFGNESNRKVFEQLKSVGVNMQVEHLDKDSDKFKDYTFVITGTLPTLNRNEATDLIVSNGGKVVGNVSKKTSYLLAGEAAGSKLIKAQSLSIPVIDEEDFLQMLHNNI